MAQTAVFLAALAVGALALFAGSSDAQFSHGHNGGPQKIGVNVTLCRGRNVTFAVRGNCSAYYQCVNNTVFLSKCPANLLYNSTTGNCSQAWTVRCNPFSGILLNASRSFGELFFKAAVNNNGAAPRYVGYNRTLCRGYNGTHPVKNNCSAFYQCQKDHVWLNQCAAPLLYNAYNGYCDYAWNVNCNRAVQLSQDEDKAVALAEESAKDRATLPNGRPAVNDCPREQIVNCFIDPCMTAKCSDKTAVCLSDYCNGCHAKFFRMIRMRGMYQYIPTTCKA